MTKEIEALSFVDAIFEQEKSEAVLRERDPGGRFVQAAAWCAHKDGKVVRPGIWWRPSQEEWERQAIAYHEKQKNEFATFLKQEADKIGHVYTESSADALRALKMFEAESEAETPTGKKESRSNGDYEFTIAVV